MKQPVHSTAPELSDRRPEGPELAGMSLRQLRERLYCELFNVSLPFWDKYGIDHEYGGIMCALDYDGSPSSTDKVLWFQGRAVWVYSFLYNHFGRDPHHLEVACKTKEFVFEHALQPDGFFAEKLSREGKVLKPFSGDTEGMYFIVEGLQEYAAATGDRQSQKAAFRLFRRLFADFNSPDFRYRGADFPYLRNSQQAIRPLGLWMVILYISTQMLRRGDDPEIAAIADQAIDAVVHRHFNPEIGLNTEMLYFDFRRPEEEEHKSRFGHCVEALWMAMEEAARRGDDDLWQLCATRIRRHLDAGWDHIYGGLCQWVNVDHPDYQWPVEDPLGTGLELHFTGEYEYMKALWALHETMIATLMVFERTGAEWAATYYEMAYTLINEKFSQKKRGMPGYMLFADRRMTWQPHVFRQDNYHPLRQLMLSILVLDRMIERESKAEAGAPTA